MKNKTTFIKSNIVVKGTIREFLLVIPHGHSIAYPCQRTMDYPVSAMMIKIEHRGINH